MNHGKHKRNTKGPKDVKPPFSQIEAPGKHPYSNASQEQNRKVNTTENRLTRKEVLELLFSGLVTIATIGSAVVAALQWTAMNKQLVESRKATQRQVRPYVLSDVVPLPPKVGTPIRIKYNVINYGQSPALKTQVFAAAFYGETAMEEAAAWMKKPENSITETEGGQIIPPGIPTVEGRRSFFHVETNKPLTKNDLVRLREKPNLIVTVSRFLYRDSFGDTYGTQNCFRISKDWEAEDCPGYSEIYGPD